MSAKQPTRKPTGKRKESDVSAQEGRERKRAAKRKGLKAGSRQQVEQSNNKSGNSQSKDPRIGSRKPVVLVVDDKQKKPAAPKAVKEKKLVMTPEQELASIENDDRLNDLLDRLDAGETLEAAEQAWVDQRVDRYQELMDELGIIDNDDDEDDELPFDDGDDAEFDEQKPASEEELWDRFNQVDFKPEPKPEPKKK
ncbi:MULTISPECIES: Der GTPase-activating protein YihI [Aeromonas]|uniref:Der GTPase-activating protein YihI n=1 Tax=Aeromonas allosaccharophila TaxID=656 RepID=A0A1Q5VSG4_9GAMM|nr:MULTISPECIES: Der GTPase-activating protein YihI [Aeromonas]OKP44784.1 GTPase-activating protein [Aeromonas allosaccharophila]QPR54118.1 GTPase-activating protein [Aeromonas allosaccharophila]TNI85633.1 GTPase-activating protein [Aeromonas allosaccharophila]WED76901.1 Der GTPase-activating protein YihI [Aeromonas allosaccharophila]BBU02888.1 Der GTPase-activating protein YihI [Aeromonas veronii]